MLSAVCAGRGKEVEGGVCRPWRTCTIHKPLLPAQSIWLELEKATAAALFVSLLLFLSYLDQPSNGAEVGRLERFVLLFLAFLFFFDRIFWRLREPESYVSFFY